MDLSDSIWGVITVAGVAFEAYALKNKIEGDTLSEKTRKVFRIHQSKAGRIVFGTGWLAFAGWFWGHILYGWPFPLS